MKRWSGILLFQASVLVSVACKAPTSSDLAVVTEACEQDYARSLTSFQPGIFGPYSLVRIKKDVCDNDEHASFRLDGSSAETITPVIILAAPDKTNLRQSTVDQIYKQGGIIARPNDVVQPNGDVWTYPSSPEERIPMQTVSGNTNSYPFSAFVDQENAKVLTELRKRKVPVQYIDVTSHSPEQISKLTQEFVAKHPSSEVNVLVSAHGGQDEKGNHILGSTIESWNVEEKNGKVVSAYHVDNQVQVKTASAINAVAGGSGSRDVNCTVWSCHAGAILDDPMHKNVKNILSMVPKDKTYMSDPVPNSAYGDKASPIIVDYFSGKTNDKNKDGSVDLHDLAAVMNAPGTLSYQIPKIEQSVTSVFPASYSAKQGTYELSAIETAAGLEPSQPPRAPGEPGYTEVQVTPILINGKPATAATKTVYGEVSNVEQPVTVKDMKAKPK